MAVLDRSLFPIIVQIIICIISLNAAANEPDYSDSIFENLPGNVDREYILQYNQFKEHIISGAPVDEQLLNIGQNLVQKLQNLLRDTEGNNNLKANILLMHVHDWNSLAYLKLKLLIEVALENNSFSRLCENFSRYCPESQPIKMEKTLQRYVNEHGELGILGLAALRDTYHTKSIDERRFLIIEAHTKYTNMLGSLINDEKTCTPMHLNLRKQVEDAFGKMYDSLFSYGVQSNH